MKRIFLIALVFLSVWGFSQDVDICQLPLTTTGTTGDYLIKEDSNCSDPNGTKAMKISDFVNTYINTTNTSPLFFAKAATTAPLAPVTYSSNTLTAVSNGRFANVDGIKIGLGDSVLIKNQASGLQNGLFILYDTGTVSTTAKLVRCISYDQTSEVYPSQINILSGTINAEKFFLQTTVNPTIGTNPLVFVATPAPAIPPSGLLFADVYTTSILPNSPVYAAGTNTVYPAYLATYSATTNGAFPTLQGYTPTTNDVVLVMSETDSTKNGDYRIVSPGGASSKWVIQRVGYNISLLYFHVWEIKKGSGQGKMFQENYKPSSNTAIGSTAKLKFIPVVPASGMFVTSVATTTSNGLTAVVTNSTSAVSIAIGGTNLTPNSVSTNTLIVGGVSTSTTTGTGALVMATSPTLITPALGTPSALVGTNITGTGAGFTAGLATNMSGGLGGQIPYQSAANTSAFLANGTAGQVLQSNGGTSAPSWVNTTATTIPFTQILYVDNQIGTDAVTATSGQMQNPYKTIEYVIANVTSSGTVTLTTTSTSRTLTAVSTTTNIAIGQYITGTGIPYGSVVTAFTSSTIVVSKAATASSSITATYIIPYRIRASGNFIWSSNWYKEGFTYDFGNSTILFSGKAFDRGTNVRLTPEYIVGGYWYGTSTSSQFYSYGNASSPNHEMIIRLNSYYSLGTGYQLGDNNSSSFIFANKITIDIPVFDCRFGSISYMSANNCQWKGYKYGLLGGINIINASGYYESSGQTETPASVVAINCTAATNIVVNDNILGSIVVSNNGGATFNGSIDGSTIQAGTINYWSHNFNGPIYRPTITTAGNVNIHSFELCTINHSQGTLNIGVGNGTFNISGGTCILNGTHRSDFVVTLNITSTGNMILNGNCGRTTAIGSTISIASGASVTCNGNYVFMPKDATGAIAGTLTIAKEAVYIWDYSNGVNETITGTINIYGTVKLTQSYGSEVSSTTPTIKLTTGTVLLDGGRLECPVAGSKSGLIRKQADGGKVILKGQCYMKVANGLAPIQILSNTGTAPDIFDFSLIDNCATSFRLADTFTDVTYGTAYAPNLLIGGTRYEATTNSW